jgi:hypothetical protein
MPTSTYAGPERRRHRLYITRFTEYHVRDGRVVAVRGRGETRWQTSHRAVGMKVEGHIEDGALAPRPGAPSPGERLYLATEDLDVVTSTVVAIERPSREIVAQYPTAA